MRFIMHSLALQQVQIVLQLKQEKYLLATYQVVLCRPDVLGDDHYIDFSTQLFQKFNPPKLFPVHFSSIAILESSMTTVPTQACPVL